MADDATSDEIHEVFPYLRVRDAQAAIEFYKKALGAVELFRLAEPSGRIGHAELKLGKTVVMLSEEYPDRGILSPLAFGGTGSMLHLHVTNVDEITARAVECGATLTMPPKDQFYGERTSKFLDPFGHEWMLGQSVETVAPDEMQRRYDALFNSTE